MTLGQVQGKLQDAERVDLLLDTELVLVPSSKFT
jgi:hypothetical protein